ncbi:ribonuclease HII [bacterium]|nr:ribonuclease HII [bacterium]
MQNYFEKRFNLTSKKILGIDEAGRGNLAGPMVVGGCILFINELDETIINQINDSKLLSKKQRKALFNIIIQHSIYDLEVIDVKTINELGPKKASIYGMQQVIKKIEKDADFIIVDFEHPQATKRLIAFAHADAISLNVAASSILAKYYKDYLMELYVKSHPQYDVYDFIHNAGYGTKKHLAALKEYGKILDFHRLNYAPVKATTKINSN